MRNLILVTAGLFFASCNNNTEYMNPPAAMTGISVPVFNVELYSGDEGIERFEIRVYKRENKVYADNLAPIQYYGEQTDSIWTVALDQLQVEKCNQFLNKARSLPKQCEETSTTVKNYIIRAETDTIMISGDCDWEGLDFFTLREFLFKKKFEELEIKKTLIINDLNKQLIGRWYFKALTREPQMDDYFILTKANDSHSNCYWEFGKENSFKNSCNDVFNFTYSNKYEWQLEKEIYFKIQAGYTTNEDGIQTIGNYDATFMLENLNENELKLKFLWR